MFNHPQFPLSPTTPQQLKPQSSNSILLTIQNLWVGYFRSNSSSTYFKSHQKKDTHCFFYMKGEALSWFKWAFYNTTIIVGRVSQDLWKYALEIGKELAIICPTHINKALGLAKLVEAKIKDSKTSYSRLAHFSNPNNP
ncbi:hypothetical protein Lal_00022017 [Lupinus albus]|nr:hypothetical protein Lal_00022017 [Lupinus albus]